METEPEQPWQVDLAHKKRTLASEDNRPVFQHTSSN